MDFDTLFQFLSLVHELNGNAGALELIKSNIAAQQELIQGCQTYLTFLEQYAPRPPLSEILALGTSDAIQGHLAENEAILRGMEESRQALFRNQERIVVNMITIIPR